MFCIEGKELLIDSCWLLDFFYLRGGLVLNVFFEAYLWLGVGWGVLLGFSSEREWMIIM